MTLLIESNTFADQKQYFCRSKAILLPTKTNTFADQKQYFWWPKAIYLLIESNTFADQKQYFSWPKINFCWPDQFQTSHFYHPLYCKLYNIIINSATINFRISILFARKKTHLQKSNAAQNSFRHRIVALNALPL